MTVQEKILMLNLMLKRAQEQLDEMVEDLKDLKEGNY